MVYKRPGLGEFSLKYFAGQIVNRSERSSISFFVELWVVQLWKALILVAVYFHGNHPEPFSAGLLMISSQTH